MEEEGKPNLSEISTPQPVEPQQTDTVAEFGVQEQVANIADNGVRQEMADNNPAPMDVKIKDEHGVSPELEPYKAEMEEWVEAHTQDFNVFLQYSGRANFKIICGKGFYHQSPQKEGDPDIICLSVPYYKECRDTGKMTIDQILFGSFHEFAHLKQVLEQDLAGQMNHMEQFKYEQKKKILTRDSNGVANFPSLQPLYRKYYNICEDAIVNSMVTDTGHFGANVAPEKYQQIVDLYTDKFFPLFRKVADGQGEYVVNTNPDGEDSPYIFVGAGQGNLSAIGREEYERGFDWNDPNIEPAFGRRGQFITFFIKHEMIGIHQADIKDEQKNPNGKFELNEDTTTALSKPLVEAYETLLRKVVAKYENDPQQMDRLLRFMSDVVDVPVYVEKGGEVVELEEPEFYENVVNPKSVGNNYSEINISMAVMQFRGKLRNLIKSYGLSGDTSASSYLDIFDQMKETTRSKQTSWTKPLRYNLLDRNRINRMVLEPIFTMLCILDDNFEFEAPPENPISGKGGVENPNEEPGWQKGDDVRNDDKQSPFYGREGRVVDIKREGSKIISVTVEYFDLESMSVEAMADTLEVKAKRFNGESEEIYNPDKNLVLLGEEGDEGEGEGSSKDKRKKDLKKKESKGKDKDKKTKKQDGKKPEGEPKKDKGEGKEDEPKEGKKKDLNEIKDPYYKYLKNQIEQGKKKKAMKEFENQRRGAEYQKKKAEFQKGNDLLEKLKKERKDRKAPAPKSRQELDLSDKAMVKKYMELEALLKPYANKMAEEWLEVVRNISSRIDVVVDKYYRVGRVDVKKMQQYFGQIEYGEDVDRKMIHKLIIEKIKLELKPRMLRVGILIDNSGSMQDKIDPIRMSVMLLNSSLRSFRVLFKNQMERVLGNEYTSDIDVVCDTEIRMFGAKSTFVKSFDIEDFAFLTKPEIRRPKIDVDGETINTMLAFQQIDVNEGSTRDRRMWEDVVLAHDNPELLKLLREGILSEMYFQISDGGINEENKVTEPKTTPDLINKFKQQMNVATAGFAIGSGAKASLEGRHGEGNVISASTPDEIVESFGELLKNMMVQQIERPMEEVLEDLEKQFE